MSTKHIPLPFAHFDVGIRLPMDPAFVDFFVYALIQQDQIHPNAIQTFFPLFVYILD